MNPAGMDVAITALLNGRGLSTEKGTHDNNGGEKPWRCIS